MFSSLLNKFGIGSFALETTPGCPWDDNLFVSLPVSSSQKAIRRDFQRGVAVFCFWIVLTISKKYVYL